jgi:hypothetical protein
MLILTLKKVLPFLVLAVVLVIAIFIKQMPFLMVPRFTAAQIFPG